MLQLFQSLMEYNSSCLQKKNNSGLTPFHIVVHEGKLRFVYGDNIEQ